MTCGLNSLLGYAIFTLCAIDKKFLFSFLGFRLHKRNVSSETYLGQGQKSLMENFCENS